MEEIIPILRDCVQASAYSSPTSCSRIWTVLACFYGSTCRLARFEVKSGYSKPLEICDMLIEIP